MRLNKTHEIMGGKLIALLVCALQVSTLFAVEWSARPMNITSVSRHPVGTVQSVDLAFGADNGSVNKLYVAYGNTDGGNRLKDWEQFVYLGEVTDATNSWHAAVPSSRFCRFFLIDSSMGVPLKWVTASEDAYVDTGFKLKGGDAISLRFRPEKVAAMSVFGTRKTVNSGNITVSFAESLLFGLDYCNGDYATFRLQLSDRSAPTNIWYDIVLSAFERSIRNDSGTLNRSNTVVCDHQFETEGSCWLFGASGSPVYSKKATGSIASFEIVRDGESIASYIPFRFGGTYGFFDQAASNFVSATEGSFSGEEDEFAFSPFASSTEVLAKEPGSEIMQTRDVSVVSIDRSGDEAHVQLAFGPDNGCANRLYAAYGDAKGGNRLGGWENVQYLGVVDGCTNSWRATIPSSAKFCRFFLFLPFEGDDAPVPLQYVSGNGSGYFDTGFTLKGGDAISVGVRVSAIGCVVLGTRKSVSSDNISVSCAVNAFGLDYNNGDYGTFRLLLAQGSAPTNNWYDIVLSATERSVRDASGTLIGANTVVCEHEFETTENCWLFGMSGNPPYTNRLTGDISCFTVKRGANYLASYSPCRIGERYGFYDLAQGVFVAPAEGTFSGVEDESDVNPLASMTKCEKVHRRGIVVSFR